MEFRKILTLRGPNIWANYPVLEAWVDLGALKDSPSDELPGFNERLMSWLPTMIEHRCNIDQRGGFFERLRRGTNQAHILEHVTLELQSLAGSDVGFGREQETSEDGVFKVAIAYHEEGFAKACLHTARELLEAAVNDRPFDVVGAIQRLRSMLHKERFGPSTGSIVRAAVARGIPFRRLNTESLVVFGHGARQRRILASETDRTGAIAESIAQDKELTRSLLKQVGVPVPEGRPVTDADDAWAAAQEIGAPVVVKPQFGSQGRGVATNLSTPEQVKAAYESVSEDWTDIVVERYAPGADYRVLVVGGRAVAASRRDPAQVVGDGRHTIADLTEIANRDPRRGDDHATMLSKLVLDPIALQVLEEQGYTTESIPPAGHRVLIRRNANLSTGGTATDVTDRMHPEVAARSVEAARIIGLDVAGVDVIAQDISRPLEEQAGIIVEVNAAPGLRMHLEPSSGTKRPVGEAIISLLYPEGETGRVPIVAVTGVNGKTTTTRLIAQMVRQGGKTVGMTCTDGVRIGERWIEKGDCSGPQSARAVLLNPRVEAAVLETARGGILREGLGFDRCDVAVVTNMGEGDHLGLGEIHTLEKLALVKRTIVEVVAPTGSAVLNAADPLVAEMAPKCPGSVIFFARDGRNPVLTAHLARGGRTVFVRHDSVVLAEGEEETVLVSLSRVPLTHHGRIEFQVENVLAASAAAWALGLPLETIVTVLEVFTSDLRQTPGRFNVLPHGDATVVIDYGHNPSALLALVDAIGQLPHRRRLTVFSAAGDRRDQDILRQGEILGDNFDFAVLFEDGCNRGRPDGEVIALLRQGMSNAQRLSDTLETRGELAAVEAALSRLRPGDLLYIQPDQVEQTLAFVQNFLASNPPLVARDRAEGARVIVGV